MTITASFLVRRHGTVRSRRPRLWEPPILGSLTRTPTLAQQNCDPWLQNHSALKGPKLSSRQPTSGLKTELSEPANVAHLPPCPTQCPPTSRSHKDLELCCPSCAPPNAGRSFILPFAPFSPYRGRHCVRCSRLLTPVPKRVPR